MGLGDQLIATGMAKGASTRGKRIAFGNRKQILWDKNSDMIFRRNPNVAKPGSENDPDIEWIEYYKGCRIYNRQDAQRDRWIWNMDFRPAAGEMFFDPHERRNSTRYGSRFVLIEPNIEGWKSVAPNKDWGLKKYQEVANRISAAGYRVCQFRYDKSSTPLNGVEQLRTLSFRDALGVLSQALLYVGPEGGLHHGAAAVGTEAVVLFGGFIPPTVTGYENHANLTGGAEACGSLHACSHCKDAMNRITVEEVFDAAMDRL